MEEENLMAKKNSCNKIWALGLMLTGGTALLLAQAPVQTVSAERRIVLHVKFAELDQEKERQFGVDLLAGPGGGLSINQALNLLTLDPKLNLGAFLKVLQNESILQVLAEPTLVTTDGKEANFLVGGEFPVPIVQGAPPSGGITVQFRKYGVNLTFTPTITPSANLAMHLKQEVTMLDLDNAVTMNGFKIPALSTRTAESTVELGDGQSFVVAGLVNNQEQSALSKVPFISSIPILGMFKPKDDKPQHSDLIMIVTPEFATGRSPVVEN
jgi:pilus assembly protein CpaC